MIRQSRHQTLVVGVLTVLTTLAALTNAAPIPEAYKQGAEARGLMDEALKKFYFDLYDQEDGDGRGEADRSGHEGHSFKFDDYFVDQENIHTPAIISKKKDKIEANPALLTRNTKLAPFPLPPPRTSPRLPVSPSQSQVPAVSAPAQDPTFVLSRLLFHLSQLPTTL